MFKKKGKVNEPPELPIILPGIVYLYEMEEIYKPSKKERKKEQGGVGWVDLSVVVIPTVYLYAAPHNCRQLCNFIVDFCNCNLDPLRTQNRLHLIDGGDPLGASTRLNPPLHQRPNTLDRVKIRRIRWPVHGSNTLTDSLLGSVSRSMCCRAVLHKDKVWIIRRKTLAFGPQNGLTHVFDISPGVNSLSFSPLHLCALVLFAPECLCRFWRLFPFSFLLLPPESMPPISAPASVALAIPLKPSTPYSAFALCEG
jgi:hypothetical protein